MTRPPKMEPKCPSSQSLLPRTSLMPLRIPIGTSSSLGIPTIEMSSSSGCFLIFFRNQIPKPTTASTATAPITAPAIMALFSPTSAASKGAGPVVLLLLEGKGELGTVGNEYVGETTVDELGPSVKPSVVEGTVVVAVTVESVGVADGCRDSVCVFSLVVNGLEVV